MPLHDMICIGGRRDRTHTHEEKSALPTYGTHWKRRIQIEEFAAELNNQTQAKYLIRGAPRILEDNRVAQKKV